MAPEPQITSQSFVARLPPTLSPRPLYLSLTRLQPSSSLLLHITTDAAHVRLSDHFVLSLPHNSDTVSTRLEGLSGLDDDFDRLAKLLGRCLILYCKLRVAKKLGRQCFVSGDLDGLAKEGRGQVVGIVCNAVERLIRESK
jgi:hypothetical protein